MATTPATFANEYPRVVLDPSQSTITRIMEGDTAPRQLDLQLRATPTGGVRVYHDGTRIGDTDPSDATELHRRIPRLAEGVTVAAVIFQADRRWHVRYNTATLYRDHPIDPQAELQRLVTVTNTTLRQIQRWIGWLVALAVIWLAASFVSGIYAGIAESEPQSVILQLPDQQPEP